MKAETEKNVRTFLEMDSSISREAAKHFIDILKGNICDWRDLGLIRYKTLKKLTGFSRNTIHRFTTSGFFDLAYVKGRTLPVGITLESYNRFLHDHHEDNWKRRHT